MAHLYYEVDYTIVEQVKALVEKNVAQQNQIIDLRLAIKRIEAELKYSQKERQRLDTKLMEQSL